MQRFLIASESGKGRSFEGLLLCAAYANTLWEGGQSGSTHRPIFAMLGVTEQAAKPILANLRMGRKLNLIDQRATSRRGGSDQFPQAEFLKSAEYRFFTQRVPSGVVLTAYLPDLFDLDASMIDPEKISFCLLPSRTRVLGQALSFEDMDMAAAHGMRRVAAKLGYERYNELPTEDQIRRLVTAAQLFAICLDRRTRCPLIQTLTFQTQILVGALLAGIASLSTEDRYYMHSRPFGQNGLYTEQDVEECGLLPGFAMYTSHETFEEFLRLETKFYLSHGGQI